MVNHFGLNEHVNNYKKLDRIDLSIPNDDRMKEKEREREIYNPNISMI